MAYIHNLHSTGRGIAFTDINVPGNPNHGDEPMPAPREHLETHAKVMNERAADLGIKARYEVRD